MHMQGIYEKILLVKQVVLINIFEISENDELRIYYMKLDGRVLASGRR